MSLVEAMERLAERGDRGAVSAYADALLDEGDPLGPRLAEVATIGYEHRTLDVAYDERAIWQPLTLPFLRLERYTVRVPWPEGDDPARPPDRSVGFVQSVDSPEPPDADFFLSRGKAVTRAVREVTTLWGCLPLAPPRSVPVQLYAEYSFTDQPLKLPKGYEALAAVAVKPLPIAGREYLNDILEAYDEVLAVLSDQGASHYYIDPSSVEGLRRWAEENGGMTTAMLHALNVWRERVGLPPFTYGEVTP